MRILSYYIAGVTIGIAMVAGLIIFIPDVVEGLLPDDQETSITPISGIQQVTDDVSNSRRNAITRAVRDAAPAVVGINVIQVKEYRYRSPFFQDPFFRPFFPDQIYRQKVENLGSGFIISTDGYVLTNEHVIHQATKVVVTMSGGKEYEAEIVGYDYESDVALLKVDSKDLPYIPLGDSKGIIIGEWSIAIGNPFGLFSINSQPTVTVGVVSAVDRDFDRKEDGKLYQDMIQTDASINRGNSGGPLVNSLGEAIGMNTMIFTESGGSIGLGFAIPSDRLKDIFESLKERGEIARNFWLGIHIQNVNRVIAMSLQLPELRGVIITDVEPGSPAEKSGLEAPDVIFALNDIPVNNSRDVQRFFTNTDLRVGDDVKFTVFRGSDVVDVIVELDKKG